VATQRVILDENAGFPFDVRVRGAPHEATESRRDIAKSNELRPGSASGRVTTAG